jgi:exodeoxyribonuclease VII small subunit
MENEKLTYSKAVEELENILKSLENTEEINMDMITVQVERASHLMKFCKNQLSELDRELEKMLQNLE